MGGRIISRFNTFIFSIRILSLNCNTPIILAENQQKGNLSNTAFPFTELAKQGVNMQEITVDTDMHIPINSAATEGNINIIVFGITLL